MQDKFIISIKIKKTIEYVFKFIDNYPHEFIILKNNIINSFDSLLRLSYEASISKDIDIMKKIVVEIKMIEFYTKLSVDNKLISYKKFINIGNYLLEINKMVNSWIINEKKRQSIS